MTVAASRYLALGDSFTIGTGVTPDEAFPAVLVARWRARGRRVALTNPALNGYTTQDLIERELPLVRTIDPDLVTVLIGANDIVRGIDDGYGARLERIFAALEDVPQVVALPQPDWSASPAARDHGDPTALRAKIDELNATLREQAELAGARYIDLFPLMRRQAQQRMLAPDGLHPSAQAHAEWASALDATLDAP